MDITSNSYYITSCNQLKMNLLPIIIIGILILPAIFIWSKNNENKTLKIKPELKSELELSSIDFAKKFETLKISGGTLRFWGNWFGKPMDNYHEIKMVEFKNETRELTLILGEMEKVRIWNPSNVQIIQKELRIEKADKILFEWYYYGKDKTEENLRFQSYIKKGTKIKFETDFMNNKQKTNCELTEPALRIIGY